MRNDTRTVQNLKSMRNDALMTQKELAEKANVSEFTVSRAEAGQAIAFSTIRKLAKALSKLATDLADPPSSKAFDS